MEGSGRGSLYTEKKRGGCPTLLDLEGFRTGIRVRIVRPNAITRPPRQERRSAAAVRHAFMTRPSHGHKAVGPFVLCHLLQHGGRPLPGWLQRRRVAAIPQTFQIHRAERPVLIEDRLPSESWDIREDLEPIAGM